MKDIVKESLKPLEEAIKLILDDRNKLLKENKELKESHEAKDLIIGDLSDLYQKNKEIVEKIKDHKWNSLSDHMFVNELLGESG